MLSTEEFLSKLQKEIYTRVKKTSLKRIKTSEITFETRYATDKENNIIGLNLYSGDYGGLVEIPEFISELSNTLKYLTIANTFYISDLQNLRSLKKLEYLNLENNQIKKLDGLETLLSLKYLNVSRNRLENIDAIHNLNKLETLKIGTVIKPCDLGFVSNFKNLKYIEINFDEKTVKQNNFSFEKLSRLTEASLISVGLTSVKGIENAQDLKYLYLTNNYIINIEPIGKLPKLKVLHLSNNKIENIDPLINLKETLETLHISKNPIRKNIDWSYFKKLKTLSLPDNLSNEAELNDSYEYLDIEEVNYDQLTNILSKEIKSVKFSIKTDKKITIKNNVKIDRIDIYDSEIETLEINNNAIIKKLSFKNVKINNLQIGNIYDLEYLYFSDIQIKNLTVWNLPINKLEYICFDEDKGFESVHISGLDELIEINLVLCDRSSDLSVMNCDSLRNIKINHPVTNNSPEIEKIFFSGLTNLSEFDIFFEKVKNFTLKRLPNIRKISFPEEIENLTIENTNLGHVFKLQNIIIKNIKLSEIDRLQEVYINNCYTKNITLKMISGLQILDFSRNLISKVTTYDCRSKNIRVINLSKNKLKRVPEIIFNQSLAYLNISNNPLSDLTDLKYCKRIEKLLLDNCGIESIDFVKDLDVKYISLNHNPIKDLFPLIHNKKLKTINLRELDIKDIPVDLLLSGLPLTIHIPSDNNDRGLIFSIKDDEVKEMIKGMLEKFLKK